MVLVMLLGGYVLISFILMRFPNLIHKKKHLKFRPKHISHRGGAADRLENTMEAFKHAESTGTEMLELDCHLTKDKQVVVSHDDLLTRTCGVAVRISETNYGDLPPLKDKIMVDFYQSLAGQGRDRRILLLKEVFEVFPRMPVNIDIKEDDDELIKQVDILIREYKREGLTAWGNRSDSVCQKLYAINPKVPLIFSLRQVLYLIVVYWTGLLPFVSFKESLLEVVVPGLLLDSEEIFQRPLGRKASFFFWLMDKLLMRPSLIQHLDKRGIQTYLWVLNREQDFERAYGLGAAGVMTDRPQLLKNYLERRYPRNVNHGDHIKQP